MRRPRAPARLLLVARGRLPAVVAARADAVGVAAGVAAVRARRRGGAAERRLQLQQRRGLLGVGDAQQRVRVQVGRVQRLPVQLRVGAAVVVAAVAVRRRREQHQRPRGAAVALLLL